MALLGCSGDGPESPPGAPQPEPGGISAVVTNQTPTAQFSVSPRWPRPGDTVAVDGTFSYDGDGQVTQYTWDFGNGVVQVTGAVAKTVFRTAGTYTVSLTAKDDSNATASTSLALVVNAAGAPASAVDSAQSSLTLSSATTTAAVPVTGTITVRNAAGTALAGVSAKLGATGRRTVIVQPASTTNGSGITTGTVTGIAAETKSVRALADFTAIGVTRSLTIAATTISAARSALRITQTRLASAIDSAIVEVTVRDTAGNPVSGTTVSLAGAGGTISVTGTSVTDVNGRVQLTVFAPSSCNNATITLTATAGGVQMTTQPVVTAAGAIAYGVCGASLWLDGDDASTQTVDGSNKVSEWRDKSGRALKAVQATAGLQPLAVAAGLNGRRTVRFGSALTRLLVSQALAGVYRSVDLYVVSPASSTNGGMVFSQEEPLGGVNPRRFQTHLGYSDGNAYWDFGLCCSGDGRLVFALGSTAYDQRVSVWNFGSQPGAASERFVRRDGAALVTGTGTDSLFTTSRDLAIGASQLGNANVWWWTGDIAEILLIPRVTTPAERALIEAALMLKWKLGNVAVTAGDAQSDTAGTSPPIAPQVRITTDAGAAIAGASVRFSVTSGGGRIAGDTALSVTTDGSGYATLAAGAWVLDAGTNVITVTYGSRTATITGTGTLPSGIRLRYDFGDASSMFTASGCTGAAANGAGVACVLDKSGNNTHGTNDGVGMPLRLSAGINGRNSLSFPNVTSDHYFTVTAADVRALRSGSRSIFAVVKPTVTQDNVTNYSGTIAIWPGWHNGLYVSGYPNANLIAYDENALLSGGAAIYDEGSITNGATLIATHTLSVGSTSFTGRLWKNGVATPGGAQTVTAAMSGSADLFIGLAYLADPDWRMRFGGTMGEFILFNKAVTTAERQVVERYLGWKWGVSVP